MSRSYQQSGANSVRSDYFSASRGMYSQTAKQQAKARVDKYDPSNGGDTSTTYVGEIRNFRDQNQMSSRMQDYYAAGDLVKAFDIRKLLQKGLLNDYFEKESNGDETMGASATVKVPFTEGYVFSFSTSLDISGMSEKEVKRAVKGIFKDAEDDDLWMLDVTKQKK